MAPPKIPEMKLSSPDVLKSMKEIALMFQEMLDDPNKIENPVGLDLTTDFTVIDRETRQTALSNRKGTPRYFDLTKYDYVARLPISLGACAEQWYEGRDAGYTDYQEPWFFLDSCFVKPYDMDSGLSEKLFGLGGGLLSGEGIYIRGSDQEPYSKVEPKKEKERAEAAKKILIEQARKYIETAVEKDTRGDECDILEVELLGGNFNVVWNEDVKIADGKPEKTPKTLDGIDGKPDAFIKYRVKYSCNFPEDKNIKDTDKKKVVWTSSGGEAAVYIMSLSAYWPELFVVVRDYHRDAIRTFEKVGDSPAVEDKESK
jgi:hypothetical protein